MYVVWGYTFYLLISVALTIWVAQTLSKNGLVFLVDAFLGNRELANSVNHLLVVGFYLINVGYVSLALKYGDQPANLQQVIEVLSSKVGMVLIVLGAMHFFNLYVFNRMRKRAITRNAPPPVMPQRTITPPPQPAH
jgi:Na+/melibiose symporter-like transporter